MILKLFLFLLPLALFSGELVWNGDVSGGMSQVEYDRVIKEYVDKKYPERVEAWKRQREIERQKEIQRQKEKQKAYEKANRTVTLDGLMWQDNEEAKTIKRDWMGAKEYCKDLTLAGFSDWRLPNIEELKSIVDEDTKSAIKKEFRNIPPFFFLSVSNYYWSSTTYVIDTSQAGIFWFGIETIKHYYKTANGYVRCVRARE